MAGMSINKTVTVGNLLTIGTLLVSVVATAFMYMATIDQHSNRLEAIEQNQKALEARIQLLETEMQTKQNKLDKIQSDLNRTIDYMQLLLDKEHIQYVK